MRRSARALSAMTLLVCAYSAGSQQATVQPQRAVQFENWLPANPPGTLHTDVNDGDAPIEVMVVELKKAG